MNMNSADLEQRAEQRETASLLASLSFGSSVATCCVLDLTEHGARLLVPSHLLLPSVMDVHIGTTQATYVARLCWRTGDEVGVRSKLLNVTHRK